MILFLQRLQILNNVRGDLRADELRNMATFEELQTENGVGYLARYLNKLKNKFALCIFSSSIKILRSDSRVKQTSKVDMAAQLSYFSEI